MENKDRDRRLIKSMSNKTGVGVSFVKQSLEDFKNYGVYPTVSQLEEYLKMRLSAVAFFKTDENDNKIPYTKTDYIERVLKKKEEIE